jgi:hypothetical protein
MPGMIVWLLFIGSLIVLPGSALLALRWAARTGQLEAFQKGALQIFDEEEPVGQMTDHFPVPDRKRRPQPATPGHESRGDEKELPS